MGSVGPLLDAADASGRLRRKGRGRSRGGRMVLLPNACKAEDLVRLLHRRSSDVLRGSRAHASRSEEGHSRTAIKRSRMKNRSIVAIAHTKEKHRSQERVLALVIEALSHLGGIQEFVKPGQTVLIKPNQTVFYSAEEGCTTDPLVIGALVRLAKEAGAARVQIAESSGGTFSSIQCMQITGVAAVAEREGAELIDLGSDETPQR